MPSWGGQRPERWLWKPPWVGTECRDPERSEVRSGSTCLLSRYLGGGRVRNSRSAFAYRMNSRSTWAILRLCIKIKTVLGA